MICIECGKRVDEIYKQYAGDFRLTTCGFCSNFADKYIESESTLITIDLILHKIQVYRHILYNILPNEPHYLSIPIIILKASLCLLILDSFNLLLMEEPSTDACRVSFFHCLKLFLLAYLEFCIYTFSIMKCSWLYLYISGNRKLWRNIQLRHIVIALVVSSFGRCVVLLVTVWEYPKTFVRLVDLFILSSNVAAIAATLNQNNFLKISMIVIPAFTCRIIFRLYTLPLLYDQSLCLDK